MGAIIFGIGWVLGGICPGPALIALFNYIPYSLVFLVCMTCGQLFESYTDRYWTNLLNKKDLDKII